MMNNNLLRKLMKFYGFTFDRLVERTGMAKTTLYSIVKGSLNNATKKIQKLSNAFGVSVNVIVEGDWIDPAILDYRSKGINQRHIVYWNMVMKPKLQQICSMLGADFGWLSLVNNDNTLIPETVYGARSVKALKVGEGITGYSVEHKKLYLISNVPKYIRERRPQQPEYKELVPGVLSELCHPLMLYDRAIGTINIESSVLNKFDEDSVKLKEFARQIVRALACCAVLCEEPEFDQVLDTLNPLKYKGWRVHANLLLDKLSAKCKDNGCKYIVLLFMHNKDGVYCIAHKEPEVLAKADLAEIGESHSDAERLLDTNGIIGEAIMSDRKVYIRDLSQEPHIEIAENLADLKRQMKSMLIIPLPIMGKEPHPVGALTIISVGDHTDFLDEKTEFRKYSEILSFVYLNARRQKSEASFTALRRVVDGNLDGSFLSILQMIVRTIADSLGARGGSIFARIREKKNVIQCIATTGLECYDERGEIIPLNPEDAFYGPEDKGQLTYEIYDQEKVYRLLSFKGQEALRKDMNLREPKCWEIGERYSSSFLGVPIKLGKESIGVIRLVSNKTEALFTKDDEQLLRDIARRLAPAIENEEIRILSDLLPQI